MIDVSMFPSYQQQMRVYIEDTDCGGIVYHANYLKYMERTRSDFLRNYGYEHRKAELDGFILVVVDLSLSFKASAKMDDLLTVDVKITKGANTFMLLKQQVWRNQQLLVTADIRIAAINVSSGRATKIAPDIYQSLASAQSKTVAN